MVSAAGVDGEATEKALLTVDGEGEVSGGDEDSLAGQATVDADDEVTPTDVTPFVDRVNAGPDRSIDGWSRSGRAAGRPLFGRCGAAQGSMRPGLVVVVSPSVELVLEFADGRVINGHGRGFYFEDPSGHNMEVLTRPYGT